MDLPILSAWGQNVRGAGDSPLFLSGQRRIGTEKLEQSPTFCPQSLSGVAMLGSHERAALEKRSHELLRQLDAVAACRIEPSFSISLQVRLCKELAKIRMILRGAPMHFTPQDAGIANSSLSIT